MQSNAQARKAEMSQSDEKMGDVQRIARLRKKEGKVTS
jgi:hypothetical protein